MSLKVSGWRLTRRLWHGSLQGMLLAFRRLAIFFLGTTNPVAPVETAAERHRRMALIERNRHPHGRAQPQPRLGLGISARTSYPQGVHERFWGIAAVWMMK